MSRVVRDTLRRFAGAAAVAALVGGGCLAGLVPAAGAAGTPSSTLSGEGDSFLSPLVHQLITDSAVHLSGETSSYLTNDFSSIGDFVGSAPNNFAADFAVSERPLSSSEAATAKKNGRTFTYVPFAATPVAVGTLVPDSDWTGGSTITPDQLCPHIEMTVQDLAAVWGIDSANPVQYWSDPRFQCTNGKAIYHESTTTAGNLDPSMANFALMTYLDSDPTAKGYFQAGVNSAVASKRAVSSNITPNEQLPYTGTYFIPGGDQPFLGKLILINQTTNQPTWDPVNDAMGGARSRSRRSGPVSRSARRGTSRLLRSRTPTANSSPLPPLLPQRRRATRPWRRPRIRPPTTWSPSMLRPRRRRVQQPDDGGELPGRAHQRAHRCEGRRDGRLDPVRGGSRGTARHRRLRRRAGHLGDGDRRPPVAAQFDAKAAQTGGGSSPRALGRDLDHRSDRRGRGDWSRSAPARATPREPATTAPPERAHRPLRSPVDPISRRSSASG